MEIKSMGVTSNRQKEAFASSWNLPNKNDQADQLCSLQKNQKEADRDMIAIRVESSCFHASQTPYAVEACLLTCKTILIIKMHGIWSVDSEKLLKILATRCHILRLKCTQFDCGCGSATEPPGEAYSAPP